MLQNKEEIESQQQPAKDIAEALIQIEDVEEEALESRRLRIDCQSTQQGGDIRAIVLRNMMSHRIEVLKNISQQAHSLYITLQSVEKLCNEEISWISCTFNLWGPYAQVLERLIIQMAKNNNFLIKYSQ